MKLLVKCFFLSLIPAVVAGAITAFIAMPYLWKLEDKWHIELADSSSPTMAVIIVSILIWELFFIPFAIFSQIKIRKRHKS